MNEFLNRIAGAAMQQFGGGGGLGGLLDGLTNGQQGSAGLQVLVDRLRQGGLGPQLDSWIGTGENQPVAPQQVEQALGADRLSQLAEQLGLGPQLSSMLASVLPQLIDRLTPHGQLPQGDAQLPQGGLGQTLQDLLGGALSGQGTAGGLLGGLGKPRG